MRIKKVFIVLMLLAIISTSLNSTVFADDDRIYYMNNYQITARIDENGDMDVEETIDYVFDGSFNGIYRTLGTEGYSQIENIQVFVIENQQLMPLSSESSGEQNTYQLLNENNQLKIKAFSRSADETKTFVIKYKIKQVVTKYLDTSELYWQFTGKNAIDVSVYNYKVLIWLPAGVDKESIRAFAHGPLSGNIAINEDAGVVLTIDKLRPNNMVEARVLFPSAALNQQSKYVNEKAYGRIMAEENKWAEQANQRRMIARILIGLSFMLSFIELLIIAFIYFRYDKEYKADFQGIYYRELPYDYSPAVMAVLWNFGRVTPKEITATLMNLVTRKALELKVGSIEKQGIFGVKNEEDYVFTKLEGGLENLKQHEQFLVEWLIDDIGDGKEISLKELEKYTKTTKHAELFKKSYDTWVALVKVEAEKYQFFDGNAVKGIALGIITGVLGMGFAIFTLIAHENVLGFSILLLISVVLIIYSALVKRRSATGVEHFSKWKALRKYLTHFSLLKEAEMPAITLWEHFLVYAISLGVTKEVIKQLKVMFRDDDFKHSGLTYMYYGYLGHSMNHLDSIDHITNNIIKTTESTYTQAMSQLSSKGGSGGGFSGGGGGGGGGGGAGAF